MEALVEKNHRHLAAVVVEPLVQGAAGMRMYPARYLRDLAELCKRREVLLIVDEVFTGFGRTGPMWACESAGVVPDILCLGKALASLLPMGATLTTERVFDAFRGSKDRAFYYGHTFCGHPLGAALGREVLAIYREENILGEVARKARLVEEAFRAMAPWPGVERVRSMGMIGAADLRTSGTQGYLGQVGWRVYEEARRLGAYLRPLGSTVYVCPPLTMPDETLRELLAILHQSVRKVLESPATA
jgi:adenosylmethionine-8-amino-7-oxononanoate aminotransferase